MGESSLQVTALLRAWNDGDLDARDGAMALVPPHRSSRVPSPRSGKTGPGSGYFEGTNLSEGTGTAPAVRADRAQPVW
jgi:uncharacterized protein YbbC (DUF1343 family)